VAAEYEVNIKLNSREIETQLGQIDRKIAKIGKPKGGSSGKRTGIAGLLPSSTELKAAERGLTQLTTKTKNIQSIQDKFSERRIRALTRSNSLNEKELRLNRQLTNEARQRLRLLSQSGAKGFDATRPQGRQMSENINALANAQEKRARLANKINEMEAKGLNVDKLRKQLGKATTEQSARRFASATKEFRLLEKTIRLEESKLKILKQQQQGFASSPIRGGANMPGSPLARQARNKRIGDFALGAGFPLLFGGGAGSVIGGGLGGALGGGLAAQIGLSALGQQIDQFVAGMVDAGKALTSVGGAADFMAEKSLFSSDAMQFRIEKLIEEGQVTEAAALMTQEMAKQVGGSGLKALKDLGTEASKMGKLFGTLLLRIQAFMASALTPLLKLINSAIGSINARSQLDQMLSEAGSPEQRAQILQRSKELRGTTKIGRAGVGLGALTPEVIAQLQKEFPAVIPEGAAIEPTELERLRAADSGGGKAAREEERLQKRLGKLEEERKKILEISHFRDRIAAAEAAEDNELVIRLQGEQRIAEIEANRLKALVGITDQREVDAINIGKATEKLAAHRNTERELAELQLQKQEKFEDTIENLEHQLKLAQATSEEERERLRIEKELQELREGGMSESQLGQVGDLMRQISAENSPLNQFIKQSVESLNNLEQHAVQVSQGIGNAIGNSLVNGLQNLVTGAQSVKEVFANMLKAVADVLAQQAAQMIATYIAIGIARAFAGLSGSKSSTPDPFSANVASALPDTGSLADVAASTPLKLNAAGSYVSSPTATLVGEGGQGEYIIPESKMRESMARYSRGARGAAVVPSSGASGTSGEGGGTAVAAPIDVRYTVERINSVDYVTADQFQRGMQQAAAQGATQGEQRALTTLRQNTSQRRRIGLS
jgi:hypothetical protein